MNRTQPPRSGFTLLEMLVVLGIIAVLVGIAYGAMAPAREKARELVCVSHFRQIGQAFAMYRQDYGGVDPPAGQTGPDLGLPQYHWPLYYKYPVIWRCPSDEKPASRYKMSYLWMIGPGFPPVPPLTQRIADRGMDLPLLADDSHRRFYAVRRSIRCAS